MSLVVRRRRRNEINVIPLIDVMVVLVFFLLLAGRFEQTHSLAIVPPSTTTGAAPSGVPSLVLSVDREGKLFLEGKEVARPALEQALTAQAAKAPGSEILIVADERSLTGASVYALDAVAKAGLKPRLLTRPAR
jgi:biopolymer transport protein ExbD